MTTREASSAIERFSSKEKECRELKETRTQLAWEKNELAESLCIIERESVSLRKRLADLERECSLIRDSHDNLSNVNERLVNDYEEFREAAFNLASNRGIDVARSFAAKLFDVVLAQSAAQPQTQRS
ncbi:hypothetical protein LTS18_005374 [Coniosporium uncinatum]|uniref:Uncharacterized protein n=1 Tax=Coniosporium uncinatum TaxID=93489 RepID=A0ACC3DB00_9PEZI|nr:hypothetical protein LTS18_005374 [Coniosporium uncinatum]